MSEDYREKFKRAYFQADKHSGIQILKDPKMQNSCTYIINLQDHTIGDLLRIYLLKMKEVKFAGYRMPHPLVDKVEIKVQTTTDNTGKVVKEALGNIVHELHYLGYDFQEEVKKLEEM